MHTPVIVVVERNNAHRNLINYNLILNKFLNTYTFPTGEECLYRLRRSLVPDFVIADLNPTDQGSIDFLHMVKDLCPKAHVIFFASFDDPKTAIRLHEAGATDYIQKSSKPGIGISELIQNIKFLALEKAIS